MRGPGNGSVRLGAVLRARRIELDLSQQQFADQLGLSRTRVSAIERGQIGQARLLLEVATALGLEIVALPREDPLTARVASRQEDLVSKANRRVRKSMDESTSQRGKTVYV